MATTKLQSFQDTPLTFGVTLTEDDDRLDCTWFNPVTKIQIDVLRKNKRKDRKLVKLKVVADVKGGKRLPKGTVVTGSEADTIPYVRAGEVKHLRVNVDAAINISKQIHQGIQNYQLQQNDVVITIVGAKIGEVGIVEDKVEVCDFTENVAKVRVNRDSVSAHFILHFLDSEFGEMQTERFSVGALQYKLSLTSCRKIEIYIPYNGDEYDVESQQKILDEVSTLFERAEEQRKKGLALIDRANSVVVEKLNIPLPDEKKGALFTREIEAEPTTRLDALFNNPVRTKLIANLKKHPHKELGKLTKPQRKEAIVPKDFYKVVDLEQIDESTGRIVSSQEVLDLGSEKILLKANNILVAKLQPENGKIVIVPYEYDGAFGSGELISLLLESDDVSLKYLWAVLRSNYVLKQWGYELTGSSRMRIGSTELQQTVIPIPKRKVQDEITVDIDDMISESDKLLQEADDLSKKAKQYFISAVIGD